MGILDEAIRDHLELKRKGGAPHADLQRLEDEAFGPPSRPGDLTPDTGEESQSPGPPSPDAPTATSAEQPPSGPKGQPAGQPTSIEEPPPAPERVAPSPPPQEPAAEAPPEAGPAEEPPTPGEAAFHDFAAEEGLVAPGGGVEASASPPPDSAAEVVEEVEVVEEMELEAIEIEQPGPGAAQPSAPQPPGSDDTQPHDMEAELGGGESSAEPPAEEARLEVSEEDLELHLDDEELDPAAVLDEPAPPAEDTAPDLRVVEEDELEPEPPGGEGEDGEPAAGMETGEQDADDVLEETPEFLRETPEHDRLWFEQRPPKDFDFDE